MKISNFLKKKIIKECGLNKNKYGAFFDLTDEDFNNKSDLLLYSDEIINGEVVAQKISLDKLDMVMKNTLRQVHLILKGWHDEDFQENKEVKKK